MFSDISYPYFALLETSTLAGARLAAATLSALKGKHLSGGELGDILLGALEVEEREIKILFDGDPFTGYCSFFGFAERNAGKVAFIHIGDSSDLPTYDIHDVILLGDSVFAKNSWDRFVATQEHLIKTFLKRVSLATYTEDFIQRVVNMCYLCRDAEKNYPGTAMFYLRKWVPANYSRSEAISYWTEACYNCHTTGTSSYGWTDGDNFMARVLGHLVYAEELNRTPRGVRRMLRDKGLRKMSLS